MDDLLASIISQANELRQSKVDAALTDEIVELLTEADSLVNDALHLATTYDPEL